MMGSGCVEGNKRWGKDKPKKTEKKTTTGAKTCFRNSSHWSHEHEHHVAFLTQKPYLIFLYICLMALNSERGESASVIQQS